MKVKAFLKDNKWSTIAILIFFVVRMVIAFVPSNVIDAYYFKGFYQVLRKGFDGTVANINFPIYYLFIFTLIVLLIRFGLKIKKDNTNKKLLKYSYRVVGFVAGTISLFYILWGFNYSIPNIKSRLQIEYAELTSEKLFLEASKVASQLNSIRLDSSFETINFENIDTLIEIENNIRFHQRALLDKWKLPHSAFVRVKPIYPKGTLLRFSTAGIFLPYTTEGQIDGGLPFVTWPSTIAHEMAHGFGITDEGECNFISLLTCMDSDINYIRYSGLIMYYRYLSSALYSEKEKYNQLANLLSEQVKNDLKQIRHELNKYPDIFPDLRNMIYDHFLKSNGVSEGIKSYGTLINLAMAYGIMK